MLKSLKGQIATYDFFPATMNDAFETADFEMNAEDAAAGCVAFQAEMGFERIVIPVRYYEEPPSHYVADTEEYLIRPFVRQAEEHGVRDRVSVTLVVKAIQLTDAEKRSALLNWVTGLPVSGAYLIFENRSPSKQIKDPDFLAGALIFIHALKLNGFHVVVGYTNTESILYSAAGPDGVTMGVYENFATVRASPVRGG